MISLLTDHDRDKARAKWTADLAPILFMRMMDADRLDLLNKAYDVAYLQGQVDLRHEQAAAIRLAPDLPGLSRQAE